MEDNLIFFLNERRAQSLVSGRRPVIFQQMEDNLNFMENGRQSQYFGELEDKQNPYLPILS
jgi:hypothetical protein